MRYNRGSIPLFLLLSLIFTTPVQGAFNHPGLLHSQSDLERMKNRVSQGIEPVKSGFEIFAADPASQLNYQMRGPGVKIGRNPDVNTGEFNSDANASYQLALMWAITGEKGYAEKAIAIINAWSDSLQSVSGRDAVLMAGLGPFKMVNAAEILRYTDAGWAEADIHQCEQMFLKAIYPAIKDFALFANGNWDAAAIQTVMAIGIFCDDRAIFERALRYYINGAGNGRLTHYVINEMGQCQESGRDQQHTQLGLALLAACCEMAWQQGLDLYAYADHRLLKGFEYTAKYNLGEEVPFVETLDRTGKYHHKHISTEGRGRLRAVYEMVYNHYVNRVNMAAPYTQKAAQQVRPEGPGRPGADHPGFGTLLFSCSKNQHEIQVAPAAPAGLIAEGSPDQIVLTWVASIGATQYTVKKARTFEGPYEIIAQNIDMPAYTDRDVQVGTVYYYTVSTINAVSASVDAYPVSVCAGLPKGWKQVDIGPIKIAGSTDYDGKMLTIDTACGNPASDSEQLHFTCVRMHGDSIITARYVPQISSQFTRFGLMIRQSLDANAAQASLMISSQLVDHIEKPGWYARLTTRLSFGAEMSIKGSMKLETPYTNYGRLTGDCWLRLEKGGNTFKAYVSSDGKVWNQVGQSTVDLNDTLFVGLAVFSDTEKIISTVKFDHVRISPADGL